MGAVGSGKSTVARELASLGCVVISSDELNTRVLRADDVQAALLERFGGQILNRHGEVDRPALAARIFTAGHEAAEDRAWLERLTHPRIATLRAELIRQAEADPAVQAIVLDSPLLLESGLRPEVDQLVYVDAARAVREQRVRESRGWSAEQLAEREKAQWPLDRKRAACDHLIDNSSSPYATRTAVSALFSRLLKETANHNRA